MRNLPLLALTAFIALDLAANFHLIRATPVSTQIWQAEHALGWWFRGPLAFVLLTLSAHLVFKFPYGPNGG